MLIKFDKLKPYFDNKPVMGVIHIGAHKAEELEGYESCGISKIIWVEANLTVSNDLLQRTITRIGSTVVFGAAYDQDNVVLTLNIANNGESSSLLQFEEHAIEHPHVKYTGIIETPGFKIDTMMETKGFNKPLFNFANIDIQGAELTALKGMCEQLRYLDYVYLEVNEKRLYKDCALVHELDEFLSRFGFTREITEMTTHGWGDAFYIRK